MKFFCPHCVCDTELSDEVAAVGCPLCGTLLISSAAIAAVANGATQNPTFRAVHSRYRLESLRESFNKMNRKAGRKRQYFVWYDRTFRASVWTELDNPSIDELIALAIDAVDAEGTRSWFVHAVAKLDKSKITIELADKSEANELILNDLAKLNL